jgi:glycosyltransferase involved in cell wall biosynthesis
VKISQNGNTANNGFHNFLILSNDSSITMVGRTSRAGITHAFSQPAWDVFPQLDIGDPTMPNWSVKEAAFNSRYTCSTEYPSSINFDTETTVDLRRYQSDLEELSQSRSSAFPGTMPTISLKDASTSPNSKSRLISWLKASIHYYLFFAKRVKVVIGEELSNASSVDIHITFGSAVPHISTRLQRKLVSVVVEHGQVRWIKDGPKALKQQREDFNRLCQNSEHVWLTNVDERTLTVAKELFPEKWSVLPHPYVLDEFAPYQENPDHRNRLCAMVDSSFLLFSPSSISIGGDQQKGTDKLLEALALIRHEDGIRVGAFFVNWGQDVQKAISLIEKLGIHDQCQFIDPLPRVNLQRFMANFDLISDQFDYDAFGGLTIRALEQGMPLLSRSIGDEAGMLMGGKPPVLPASNVEEIREQILKAVREQQALGRSIYLGQHQLRSRSWVLERHHHSFAERLQVERYQQLLQSERTPAHPGRWGELPNWVASR